MTVLLLDECRLTGRSPCLLRISSVLSCKIFFGNWFIIHELYKVTVNDMLYMYKSV